MNFSGAHRDLLWTEDACGRSRRNFYDLQSMSVIVYLSFNFWFEFRALPRCSLAFTPRTINRSCFHLRELPRGTKVPHMLGQFSRFLSKNLVMLISSFVYSFPVVRIHDWYEFNGSPTLFYLLNLGTPGNGLSNSIRPFLSHPS